MRSSLLPPAASCLPVLVAALCLAPGTTAAVDCPQGPALQPIPIDIRPVVPADWITLTTQATFGPQVAAFDDCSPGILVDPDGVAHLQSTEVTLGLLSKDLIGAAEDLLVLVTLGPGTSLQEARLTVTDANGNPAGSAALPGTDALPWTSVGLPPGGIPGLSSQVPFKRQDGSVLGAFLDLDRPFAVPDPPPDHLLGGIRFELLGVAGGALRIDFLGVAAGSLTYNSSDSGGGIYDPGEPTPAAHATWGRIKRVWR